MCRACLPHRSWYDDEDNYNHHHNHNLPPASSAALPRNLAALTLTFVIPVKKRPLMLLKTVLNLYGKAAYKDQLYVRVVVYADDTATLSILPPLLAAISPNIEVRINTRVDLGYDQIEQLYALGIRTTLQSVYTDRTHILTEGKNHSLPHMLTSYLP